MKDYHDYPRVCVGYSDIATLLLVGIKFPYEFTRNTQDTADGDIRCVPLTFAGDNSYYAYIVDEDAEIGPHYKQVAKFHCWLKIYDDEKMTFTVDADEIVVYRAGDYGLLIQKRTLECNSICSTEFDNIDMLKEIVAKNGKPGHQELQPILDGVENSVAIYGSDKERISSIAVLDGNECLRGYPCFVLASFSYKVDGKPLTHAAWWRRFTDADKLGRENLCKNTTRVIRFVTKEEYDALNNLQEDDIANSEYSIKDLVEKFLEHESKKAALRIDSGNWIYDDGDAIIMREVFYNPMSGVVRVASILCDEDDASTVSELMFDNPKHFVEWAKEQRLSLDDLFDEDARKTQIVLHFLAATE